MTVQEINPASDWCQRWTDRRSSWRHTSEGGFNAARYDVAAIDEMPAKRYVEQHHYSASYPASRLRYGLFDGPELAGVAVLSVPVQAKVLTGPFPQLAPYSESLELGRLVLADAVPANAESWFLARVFELAAGAGIRGVVSFADPVARVSADGATTFAGHVGTIYQASNAVYAGRATARTLRILPDGTVLNERSLQKYAAGERSSNYVENDLVALGARPRTSGDRASWLASELARVGIRRLRHRGNHRYLFAIGSKRERRTLLKSMAPSGAYPKGSDR